MAISNAQDNLERRKFMHEIEPLKTNRATSYKLYINAPMPMVTIFKTLDITKLIQLKEKGYIPVLAHPERYSYVQEDPNQVMEFIRAGVFIQSNYGSIVGRYGKEAKETLGKLLKHNMVHILASDTHKKGFIYENIQDILKELSKYTSKQAIKRLTKINPNCIIQDEEFQIEVPTRIEERKKFFFI